MGKIKSNISPYPPRPRSSISKKWWLMTRLYYKKTCIILRSNDRLRSHDQWIVIYLHIDDSQGNRTWQVVTYDKVSISKKSCDNLITWPFEFTWMKNIISPFSWSLWQTKKVVVNQKVSVAPKPSHMTLWSH